MIFPKKCFVKTIKRWPPLEEIELTKYPVTSELCQAIEQSCPQLKCFRFNQVYIQNLEYDDEKNAIAKCIARTMHGLRSLQLTSCISVYFDK
jgi:hypothetical protein